MALLGEGTRALRTAISGPTPTDDLHALSDATLTRRLKEFFTFDLSKRG